MKYMPKQLELDKRQSTVASGALTLIRLLSISLTTTICRQAEYKFFVNTSNAVTVNFDPHYGCQAIMIIQAYTWSGLIHGTTIDITTTCEGLANLAKVKLLYIFKFLISVCTEIFFQHSTNLNWSIMTQFPHRQISHEKSDKLESAFCHASSNHFNISLRQLQMFRTLLLPKRNNE